MDFDKSRASKSSLDVRGGFRIGYKGITPHDSPTGQSGNAVLRSRVGRGVGLAAWFAALLAGFGALVAYQMRAGPPAELPLTWPRDAALPFDRARSNLVMFAHPQCPCSAASLEELKVILTRSRQELRATICFFEPPDVPADWTDTRLIRSARQIPGLNVVLDRDGTVTEKFGAITSGQVVLFDGRGQRLFAGGITSARGHAGENAGRNWIIALAKGEACTPSATPVFGCDLRGPVRGEAAP